MTPEERLQKAAEYLDTWGDAIRRDWSEFDGRQAKHQLRDISAFMRGEFEGNPLVGVVCMEGKYGVHWFGWAEDHDCE